VTTGLNVVNGQFAGRVAVNSGARLNDFGIGNSLNCTAANATNFNFIVQNDLVRPHLPILPILHSHSNVRVSCRVSCVVLGVKNATNGELFCGSALVGGNVTNPLTFRQVNEGANLVSGVDVSISGVDFASATSFLTGVNQAVCALNCTSAYTPSFSQDNHSGQSLTVCGARVSCVRCDDTNQM
jgi:hypothetical protein